ncbi:MAG: PLP-dependent transferase, partial [Christensenella sp.]
IYTEAFGKLAYITKARVQLMRDIGASPTANAAFLLNLGLETLALRMERHTANAMAAAEFLAAQPEVEFVNYAGLHGNKYYKLAQKYLPNGASGVISFSLKAGRATAVKFMDSLTLASNVVHVATAKTCVLHPASSTHRQLNDEQIAAAGITPGMIRLSVGIENIEDVIDDLKRGFAAIR